METEKYLTVQDAADKIQCSTGGVRKWIRLRELRALRAGRLIRIKPEDLAEFLERRQTASKEADFDSASTPTAVPSRPGPGGSGPRQTKAEREHDSGTHC